MNIFGLGVVAAGYALFYWALNILIQSYKRTGPPMNPPPLSVVMGIPGATAGNIGTTAPVPPAANGPGPNVPGTTQQPTNGGSISFQQQQAANNAARQDPNATSIPYPGAQ